MTLVLTILFLLTAAVQAQAQAKVVYDHPASVSAGGTTTAYTLAQVQAWVPTIYVNNTPFVMTHACVTAGANHTCTANLPNITMALTPSGVQSIQVTLKDPVLGEGARSSPLALVRPAAPSAPRIQ